MPSKERKLAAHHLDYFLNFSETFGDNLLLGAKKKKYHSGLKIHKDVSMLIFRAKIHFENIVNELLV